GLNRATLEDEIHRLKFKPAERAGRVQSRGQAVVFAGVVLVTPAIEAEVEQHPFPVADDRDGAVVAYPGVVRRGAMERNAREVSACIRDGAAYARLVRGVAHGDQKVLAAY